MRSNLLLIFISVLFSCKDDYVKKPLKYYRNDEILECEGIYKDGELIKKICLFDNNDTMLVENWTNNLTDGMHTRFYRNGKLMESGKYYKNHRVGLWRKFYENGMPMYVWYYKFNKDFNLMYLKHFNAKMENDTLYLPLSISRQPNDSIMSIGKEYEIIFKLEYSEFDSLISLIDIHTIEDRKTTIRKFSSGNEVKFKFRPIKSGLDTIKGQFVEIDATKVKGIIAEGYFFPFIYKYIAK